MVAAKGNENMVLETLKSVRRLPKTYWNKFNSRYLAPYGFGQWRVLVPADEFTKTVTESLDLLLHKEASTDLGDYVEFGVSRGTSLACVYNVFKAKNLDHVRLVGFDSFEGMPPESAEEGWTPGAYRSTLAATKNYMESQGVTFDRVELVKGWFDDTLTPENMARLGLTKASLLMVDCDTYSATKLALEFCLPLIHEQAVMIFDDWGARSERNEIGQREAFQELIADRGEFAAEPLPAYHSVSRVFLLTRLPASDARQAG